jgi:hypothetical protein
LASDDIKWSEWFTFDKENVAKVPQKAGVFRMHASMKILYIGSSNDIQKGLSEALEAPCTSQALRFCYFETQSHQKIRAQLLDEYKEKHDGKLPLCMEN